MVHSVAQTCATVSVHRCVIVNAHAVALVALVSLVAFVAVATVVAVAVVVADSVTAASMPRRKTLCRAAHGDDQGCRLL